ncbi:MAG TPA: DNA gyrase subunit A [Synechococcales cyanobacterium M55_K2018_004]|nr:DNA gyrase subunit A [Synechococcales cyanobacterium M55_K2018_004]
MARQLNLTSGQVVSTALHTEVQQSYLEYAMSVIVGRALPDVRDGLKPVHRRILYAMHELGLTPDRPFRKCARVVGDVLGKYHPHGDQAVYDALVRMVQDFSSRYPLLAGHGNFGSVDDDPPAAMRYTETRLAPVSHEALLSEISEATVDFIPNFDNSQQEPVVLPAQLPFLLLNGSSGIAVGMATNIPPHNLAELVDGAIALIDNPNLPDEELFALIPGPDFPTGGEIVGTDGILDAYRTGRGSIPIRGIAQFEEIQPGRGRHRRPAIIVTELPFQVNKAGWIEKVAELVNQGRIEGIQDIRDESDRDGMRVVIELKRETNGQRVLNQLYKLTPLQINFGAIFLALADGQPRQMSLREMLQHFLTYREQTLTRQYSNELEQAENRLHLTEGMLRALENLDAIIDILRHAPDGSTAKVQFQEEFELSDRQSDAILAMPLRRLTGMERQKLQTEYDELAARMQELRTLLNNRKELLKSLKKDLRGLKKKFADPRRTRIQSTAERTEEAAALAAATQESHEVEEVVLEFTQRGYVRRSTPKAFERQLAKQIEQPTHTLVASEDLTFQIEEARTDQDLLLLTRSGKAYTVKVGEIAPTSRQSKGTPLITLLPQAVQDGDRDALVAQFVLREDLEEWDLVMVTAQGRIKRLPLSEFTSITGRGLTALKLKEDDVLQHVFLAQTGDHLVMGTSGGRVLRFEVNDDQLPVMGRAAQGLQAVRLGKQERLVGCVALTPEDEVLLATTQGYGKRVAVSSLRMANRGDLGLQVMQFASKTDQLIGLVLVLPGTNVTLLTSEDRMARIPMAAVPLAGKDHSGERLVKLNRGERITALIPPALPAEEEDEAAAIAEPE